MSSFAKCLGHNRTLPSGKMLAVSKPGTKVLHPSVKEVFWAAWSRSAIQSFNFQVAAFVDWTFAVAGAVPGAIIPGAVGFLFDSFRALGVLMIGWVASHIAGVYWGWLSRWELPGTKAASTPAAASYIDLNQWGLTEKRESLVYQLFYSEHRWVYVATFIRDKRWKPLLTSRGKHIENESTERLQCGLSKFEKYSIPHLWASSLINALYVSHHLLFFMFMLHTFFISYFIFSIDKYDFRKIKWIPAIVPDSTIGSSYGLTLLSTAAALTTTADSHNSSPLHLCRHRNPTATWSISARPLALCWCWPARCLVKHCNRCNFTRAR